jgi:Terpene synthase family 2, C-terminal metal binding
MANPLLADIGDSVLVARAEQIHSGLLAWSTKHSMRVSSTRLQAVALTIVVMCPYSGERTLVQCARFGAVVMELDDVMDVFTGDPAFLAECEAVALGRQSFDPRTPDAHLITVLEDVCNEIGSTQFRQYVADCVRGMATEYEQRQEFLRCGKVPAYAEYLACAVSTISTSALWAAVEALDGYPAHAEQELCTAACRAVCEAGSRCVRLANDLRGFRREVSEGKPNAVFIQMHYAGVGEERARQLVDAERRKYYHELSGLVSALPAGLSGWGQSVLRFCDFVTAWYDVAELDEIPAELAAVPEEALDEEALDAEP